MHNPDGGFRHRGRLALSQRWAAINHREQSLWARVGIVAGVLILCVILSGVVGRFIYQQILNDQTGVPDDLAGLVTPSPEVTESPAVTQDTNATLTAVQVQVDVTNTSVAVASDEIILSDEPTFGQICFKPASTFDPEAECGAQFPPVVEIHAIFDYNNLSPEHEWTRIWYHNGNEVLKVQDIWTGDQTGQFDYNLNTSDGAPLSAGLWQLQLFIDGQLAAFGSFVIEMPVEVTETVPVQITATLIPTETPEPASDYELAFTKWDGGKHAVWTANLDGGNQQFLLDFAASPSWSPDGQSIAFYGEEGIDNQEAVETGTNGIWRMDADGRNPIRLIPEGTGQSLDWSPTGEMIAFGAERGSSDRHIYFTDPNGVEQPLETLGQQPSWSPDGQEVVVKVCRPECGLWISTPDDSAVRQLTGDGSDGLPAWSPDGQAIAFSRNVEGNVDVFVINVDGSGLQRLTTDPGNDSVPAWTPDGRQIAFRTTRNGTWQIFLMHNDGSGQRMIIDNVGASDEWAFDRMSIH